MGVSLPRNRITVKALRKRILAYSAIKIRAKPPALYSVLNPDTSSDSLSAKSKGVRLVSARHEAYQIIAKGNKKVLNHVKRWCFSKLDRSYELVRRHSINKMRANLTS